MWKFLSRIRVVPKRRDSIGEYRMLPPKPFMSDEEWKSYVENTDARKKAMEDSLKRTFGGERKDDAEK